MIDDTNISPAAIRDLVDASDCVARITDPDSGRVFLAYEQVSAEHIERLLGDTPNTEIDALIEAGHTSGPATPMTDADWQRLRNVADGVTSTETKAS